MKQKVLTEKQHEILGRLESVLKEANENKIGFVYDCGDNSLTAYNAENVIKDYCGRYKEDVSDEKIDWDSASIIENFNADWFDNGFDDYYLHFNDESV